MGRDCKVVGLILEGVEAFTTFADLVNILAHYTNSVIDLLEKEEKSIIALRCVDMMNPDFLVPSLVVSGSAGSS